MWKKQSIESEIPLVQDIVVEFSGGLGDRPLGHLLHTSLVTSAARISYSSCVWVWVLALFRVRVLFLFPEHFKNRLRSRSHPTRCGHLHAFHLVDVEAGYLVTRFPASPPQV